MPERVLPPNSWARSSKPEKKKAKKRKSGVLGTGIGPDVNIGLTTALRELGSGVTGLARLIAPGSKSGEPGGKDLGKGFLTSLASTALTPGENAADAAEKIAPNSALAKWLRADYESGSDLIADAFGENFRAKGFKTRMGERGILPALVEDVGNVALVAGGITAPIKGAAGVSKAAGAGSTAAKLTGLHERLTAPGSALGVAQHPYRTVGSGIRESVLKPANSRVLEAAGVVDAPNTPDAPDAPAPRDIPEPGALTRGLARMETMIQGREAAGVARDMTRAADAQRATAARSPAVQEAVSIARDHLITKAADTGRKMTRAEASLIVGDEIWARTTGVKALEEAFPAATKTVRTATIPDELKTPELEMALVSATRAQALAKAKATEILTTSRKGVEGLEGADDVLPSMTKRQEQMLASAGKKVARADSPVLARMEGRQRASREAYLASQEAKLARVQKMLAEGAMERASIPHEQARARTWGTDLPPTTVTRTVPQVAANPPKLPVPAEPGAPGAGNADFYKAGRASQEAVDRLAAIARKGKQLEATRLSVQKTIDDVRSVLNGNLLPAQRERAQLIDEAARLSARVANEQRTPSVSRTPRRWQPLMRAVEELGKEAAENPALAEALAGLPTTLEEIQTLALSKGFDAQHVRDFSPLQVKRLVFGNMRLGLGKDVLHEATAGTRKTSTGALARVKGVDRSFEAMLAATVEATTEARTNDIVTWVENSVARTLPKGSEVPEGWKLWDPVRTNLLTGTSLDEGAYAAIATTATESKIVPEAVVSTLNRFTKDYDHWAFRAISKVTSPWRTLVLTLSPGWYTRNFVGNVLMATAEGVSLKDWSAAWKSYRTEDSLGPFAAEPFIRNGGLARDAGVMADSSVIPRAGLREAIDESGKIRGPAQEAQRRLTRVNEVVDEFARAAVYHHGLNKRSLTPEQAWKRANEAMVDYGALSPFERSAVRSVVPFYSWQKGILKVTLNQAIDHPARTSLIMQMGKINDEYIADRFGVDKDDVPGLYNHLVGDTNLRSYNPFADTAELLSVEGITRSMNPFLELAVRKGLGAPEGFAESFRLGDYGQAQPDVDVRGSLLELGTKSPGARLIKDDTRDESVGERVIRGVGFGPVDEERIRTRLAKTRKQLEKQER